MLVWPGAIFMTSVWVQQNATGVFDIELAGVLAEAIDSDSLWYEAAQQFPGRLIRGRVLAQSGTLRFDRYGHYTTPTAPTVVLWALDVDDVFIENRTSLLGEAREYPDLPVDDATEITPRAGIRIDLSEDGRVRARRMFSETAYDITLVHRYISGAERTALLEHFAGYASTPFEIELAGGEGYRVSYLDQPREIQHINGRWTLTARLTGNKLFTVAVGVEAYPDLPIDAASTFVPRAGMRIDTAEDGVTRPRRLFPDTQYEIRLVHPIITNAQRTALLEHFVGHAGAVFDLEMPSGDTYSVRYLDEPRGVRLPHDQWTYTVSLLGSRSNG